MKPAIASGTVDVLLLSSCWKGPDPAIESFTRLLLAHNAAGRVLVMASWPGYDLPSPNRITDNAQRDGIKVADIRAGYAPYYRSLQAHLAGLNATLAADKTTGDARDQAVFLVPIGPAVISLRERIAQGKVPGITRQSELFSDALGHPRWRVKLLAGYCEFAVIYRRSPVGLPMPELPGCFVKAKDTAPAWSAALNRVLQEVAWEAVQQEPLCGLDRARLPKKSR